MMKKLGLTFFLNAGAGLFALIAWILFMVSNGISADYVVNNGGTAITVGIISVLLIAAGTFASIKFGSQHFITAFLKLAGLACLMVMVAILLMDRAVLAASLFTFAGTGNATGWAAFYTAVVSIVLGLLAVFVLIATAFMNNKKKEA